MSLVARKISYPYITTDPKIAGGTAIIEGTRISVRTVAGYYQMGIDVDKILATLSHLSASQLHSALAYYFDHQQEIDSELTENSDTKYWEKAVKKHPKEGT